jgi:hypothetical protein
MNNNQKPTKIDLGVWQGFKFGFGFGAGMFLWGIVLAIIGLFLLRSLVR